MDSEGSVEKLRAGLEQDIADKSEEQLLEELLSELSKAGLSIPLQSLQNGPTRFANRKWDLRHHYGVLLKLAKVEGTITPDELCRYIAPGHISDSVMWALRTKHTPELLRLKIKIKRKGTAESRG